MGLIKSALVWTNPLTYIFGAPVFAGFVLSAMFDGVVKKTGKIVRQIEL